MATVVAVTINPGVGGAGILTLLMSDGTSMPLSALSVSQDGVLDPVQVSRYGPLPTRDIDLDEKIDEVKALLQELIEATSDTAEVLADLSNPVPLYQPFQNAVSGIIKRGVGTLLSLHATNRNAATRWLQIFASPILPTTNSLPYVQFMVPAAGMIILGSDFFTSTGIVLPEGITYGFSTSSTIYAAGTAADHDFSAAFL